MTKEEFTKEVLDFADNCPKAWRKGQAVFNYIDAQFDDLARYVQFNRHVDCFYDDDSIDSFLNTCWEVIQERKK